jgi:8-oxo-dGTP pyrophosphatase MutT (NUDIX family)
LNTLWTKFANALLRVKKPEIDLHRTATVFIIHEYDWTLKGVGQMSDFQILMVKHPKYDKWMAPGGHVDPGELVYQAALREIKEETGLDIDFGLKTISNRSTIIPRPFAVVRYDYTDSNRVDEDQLYLIVVDDAVRNTPLVSEGPELRWVDSREDLDQYDMYPDTRAHIRNMWAHINTQRESENLYDGVH